VRQLPPEITRINLDGPPFKRLNQTRRLREPDSSPNETVREGLLVSGPRASLSPFDSLANGQILHLVKPRIRIKGKEEEEQQEEEWQTIREISNTL